MKHNSLNKLLCLSTAMLFAGSAWAQIGFGTNLIVDPSFEGDATTWQTGLSINPVPLDATFLNIWSAPQGVGAGQRMELLDTGHPGQDGAQALAIKSVFPISAVQVIDVSSLGNIAGLDYDVTVNFAKFGNVFDARFSLYGFNDFTGVTVDLGGVQAQGAIAGATRLFVSPNVSTIDSSANFRNSFKGQSGGVLTSNTIALSDFNYLALVISADADADFSPTQYFAYDNVSLTIVPEPSVYAILLGVAALGLVIVRRRLA